MDKDLDPVALATIAALLAPKEYDRALDRQAIVRAAMLLSEAQDLVQQGPNIMDVPNGALPPLLRAMGPLLRFSDPLYTEVLDKINRIDDSRKRFVARVKFATGEDRADRAEESFFEMLGEWATGKGESDVGAYKRWYREWLSQPHIDHVRMILFRNEFADWKAESKSAKVAAARKSRKSTKA